MYKLMQDVQPALLSTFSGDRRFSRFGEVLHLSDLDDDGVGKRGMRSAEREVPLLTGQMPWKDRMQTGLYTAGNLKKTLVMWEAGQDPVVKQGKDDRGVGHISSQFLSSADEIIMSAPLRITDATSGLLGGEDGRVYIYNGKHTSLGDVTGKCKSWITPCPEEKVKCSTKCCTMWDGKDPSMGP